MLDQSLYTNISTEHIPGLIITDLVLNETHEIFQGHFPGQPVLPGACMIQMIKETLIMELKKSIQLQKANTIKFLQIIHPGENKNMQLQIQYQELDEIILHVNASIKCKEKLCFKFTGVYEKK